MSLLFLIFFILNLLINKQYLESGLTLFYYGAMLNDLKELFEIHTIELDKGILDFGKQAFRSLNFSVACALFLPIGRESQEIVSRPLLACAQESQREFENL